MQQRAKRMAIAVVLTAADVTSFNSYPGAIWRTWGQDPWAKAALLALLALWISSAAVLWATSRMMYAKPFASGTSPSPATLTLIPQTQGGTAMFDSLEDLSAKLAATGYFIESHCADHVCHALDVVGHRSEADLDAWARQAAHQQTRMPKDAVSDGSEGMLNNGSTHSHHRRRNPFLHTVQRVFIQVASQTPL
jgi:cytochrome c5